MTDFVFPGQWNSDEIFENFTGKVISGVIDMYYTYVLESEKDGKHYTGLTANLKSSLLSLEFTGTK